MSEDENQIELYKQQKALKPADVMVIEEI